ncbi:MAG: M48 family metallopeptidase [Myxococcota bacterium]|jgi:Zn-dependent protease with chaperone function|nr:M48 family metallopeptidase [Myxococcota bacterium]
MAFSKDELREAIWPQGSPSREIVCRHCGRRNRVFVAAALFEGERCRCGACQETLFLQPGEALTGLSGQAYQHPLDLQELETLRRLPGLPAATRWLMKQLSDRQMRLLFMANGVLCGDEQFPQLVALMHQARESLGIDKRPTLFLAESASMNMMTTGVEDPLIVVQSALLDQMSDGEVLAVMGHELGHIHNEHLLYHTLGRLITIGAMLPAEVLLPGLGKLIHWSLQKAILRWSRCSELSADRAGLLASRNLGDSLQVLLTLAGGARPGMKRRTELRLRPFVAQARALADMEASNAIDSALATVLSMNARHPFIAWRVLQLLEWVETGNYLELLAGHYPGAPKPEAHSD